MKSFILSIDQGTTGSRAMLFNAAGLCVASAYQEFQQFFPKSGWVEHDAEEIWRSVLSVVRKTFKQAHISANQVAGIGITNQRETTVLWDRQTGRPLCPAIVWQDRRTADFCQKLKARGYEKKIRQKTGLVLDPYFSGSKISWILGKHPEIKKKANRGEVLWGTIDTWLLWKMTGGKVHATDPTNASRTLLFNIRSMQWDKELLRIFGIPANLLPEVRPSGGDWGQTDGRYGFPSGIPVRAVMGDQQAALYGQACYRPGEVKNTYGTGCFAVINLGKQFPEKMPKGLLVTVACDEKGLPVYALEGSVFIGGAVMQWIRDGLQLIRKASESEKLIKGVSDAGGVTLIPAFAGLGSPYWNPDARGMISGITRGTTRAHLVRAALESIAQQSADVVDQMAACGVRIRQLKVDGGATKNAFLMQFQSDLLGIPVLVSERSESTAWGAAKLAGKISGLWKDFSKVDGKARHHEFVPKMKPACRASLRKVWRKEIQRVLF